MSTETIQHAEGERALHVYDGSRVGLESIVTIGELRVNIENGTVRIGQEDIPVTATEFRILCTLMMQHAAIIRRAALLSAICEKHTHATSRSLDVHISRLRTKLRTYGSWIRTVKGVGYRFMPTIAAELPAEPREFLNAVNS
jgi:two-component system phosphate regulon response regulator PhoB